MIKKLNKQLYIYLFLIQLKAYDTNVSISRHFQSLIKA